MSTLLPFMVVIGATGLSGTAAALTLTSVDSALNPFKFLASTLNAYTVSVVRPVAVKLV